MDGTQGQVDLSVRVHAADGGVFNALADTDEFEKVFVQYGAVTWPCGVDLAPDAMYDSIRQTGFWHLV